MQGDATNSIATIWNDVACIFILNVKQVICSLEFLPHFRLFRSVHYLCPCDRAGDLTLDIMTNNISN